MVKRPWFPPGPTFLKMKTIYTILFFAAVMVFFGLAYLFINIMNSGTGIVIPGLVLIAIVACIGFLTFLLYRVMNSNDSNNENLF